MPHALQRIQCLSFPDLHCELCIVKQEEQVRGGFGRRPLRALTRDEMLIIFALLEESVAAFVSIVTSCGRMVRDFEMVHTKMMYIIELQGMEEDNTSKHTSEEFTTTREDVSAF